MLSIKENISNEIVINKSKFITNICKINDDIEINEYMNIIRNKYKDASHHCYAYVLDNKVKFSDSGEPNGTAGKPILEVLEKKNLNHILCVVTRYFGGTKLGAGGLVRAYSNSVSACLEQCIIIELIKGNNITIAFNYDRQKTIDYLLDNIYIQKKEYKELITYNLDVDELVLNSLMNLDNVEIKINNFVYIEKAITI